MKKSIKISVLLASLFLIIQSCSEEDNPVLDSNEEIGTYIGMLTGSSGYFKVYLKENDSEATISFDGDVYELISNEKIQKGSPVENLMLSDETVSLKISVDKYGNNPEISFVIPGHSVFASIFKDDSLNEITVYEGYEEIIRLSDNSVKRHDTYNMTICNNTYVVLETYKDIVYREEGEIIDVTDTTLTFRVLRTNDGGDSPMEDLDLQDQQESEVTFQINEGQLYYEYNDDNIILDIIELTEIDFLSL